MFIASLNSEAADFADGAVSPKVGAAVRVTDAVTVHAQYARGFRAPPYHDINTGFTNPAGGYTSLPNATLRGEAYLTDSVMIRGSYARIEGVEILHDIAVPALAEETPLGSIAPNEGALGIRYVQSAGRWGAELSMRLVESYQGAPDEDQFAPEAYQVVDLVGHVSLVEDLTLRLGALNLTDAKYFEWWNVRGRQANDPVIDRYSRPGISFITSLGYDW